VIEPSKVSRDGAKYSDPKDENSGEDRNHELSH
jgi:hypothetical protein